MARPCASRCHGGCLSLLQNIILLASQSIASTLLRINEFEAWSFDKYEGLELDLSSPRETPVELLVAWLALNVPTDGQELQEKEQVYYRLAMKSILKEMKKRNENKETDKKGLEFITVAHSVMAYLLRKVPGDKSDIRMTEEVFKSSRTKLKYDPVPAAVASMIALARNYTSSWNDWREGIDDIPWRSLVQSKDDHNLEVQSRLLMVYTAHIFASQSFNAKYQDLKLFMSDDEVLKPTLGWLIKTFFENYGAGKDKRLITEKQYAEIEKAVGQWVEKERARERELRMEIVGCRKKVIENDAAKLELKYGTLRPAVTLEKIDEQQSPMDNSLHTELDVLIKSFNNLVQKKGNSRWHWALSKIGGSKVEPDMRGRSSSVNKRSEKPSLKRRVSVYLTATGMQNPSSDVN